MQFLGFGAGVLLGVVGGGMLGLMLGNDMNRVHWVNDFCGYDRVIEFQNEGERTAVCNQLKIDD